jgi:hypothetical protein
MSTPIGPRAFEGKANPMTVVTPMRARWRPVLWLILGVFRHLKFGVVRKLAFIHFARWVLVRRDRLPRLCRHQAPEPGGDDLYLFTTNFNGPWDQYIDAFGMVQGVRGGLNFLWVTSRGFPMAWPMRPFKRYIRYFEYPQELYYNAYPGASVRDIASALALRSKLDAFIAASATVDDAAAFARQWRAFIDDAAPLLGTVGGEREALPSRHSAHPIGLQT